MVFKKVALLLMLAISVIAKKEDVAPSVTPFGSTGLSHSTAMSQMVILPDDVGVSSSILPPGLSDINGHQLDLRKTNSWLLKMDEIPEPENAEKPAEIWEKLEKPEKLRNTLPGTRKTHTRSCD